MRTFVLQALILLTAFSLGKAAPGFESISPAGGKVGTSFVAKVAGKGLDKGAPQGWCSNPGVKITPAPGAKPGSGLWSIEIAKDAAPGACLVRFHSDDGSTPPRIFEVGTLEEVAETEPNDAFKEVKAAAELAGGASPALQPRMNATFNGVLAKEGDADTHALRVQKGRAITLELHGYALGSSMDPAMRLLDARGVELAASHDTHNLDPLIRHVPAADGVLYVQVFAFVHPPQADIAYKGTANHVYRLHVTDSGQASPAPGAAAAASASPLTTPITLVGSIATPEAENTHLLTVKKGDDLRVTVRAKAIRSPLEATLRIESAEGKMLVQNDDGESISSGNSATALDPALRWKAPADGTYKLIIGDRFQNGTADHHYELSVQVWKPTVAAALDAHAYRLEPGKIEGIKITVKFDGTYPEKLRAHVAGLPPGVVAEDVDVPAKGGEVNLPLKAAADAAPAQVPLTIELVPVAAPTPGPPADLETEAKDKSALAGKEKKAAEASASTPAAAPASTGPVAMATYAIPFTELRGDLLIVTDTRPWLTVPKGGAKPEAKPPKDKAVK
ncbi:MAG TPA: hypothetical protein VGE39_11030 [Prosthecobacter sp.]